MLASILSPIMGVIEKSVPDKAARDQIQAELIAQMLDNNSDIVRAQSRIISAEAKGESWLQRSWRPISMLSFLLLLFSYWFGFAPDYLIDNPQVVEKVFSLLQIGIGGYIGSRGAEKVVQTLANNGGVRALTGG